MTNLSNVLSLLRCLKCNGNRLTETESCLLCTQCHNKVPLVDSKFPDFLTEEERSELQKEIAFWEKHFSGQVYQDESEASYSEWCQLMGVKKTDAILEVGCGSGALLTRTEAKLKVGLEPAAVLLKETRGFTGIIATAGRMPFQDESFDIVFFKHSLHHVTDKFQALIEASRITKKGGKLIVIEPNRDHPQRALISNPHSIFRKTRILTRFIGPVESFQTANEVIEQARGLNFSVKRVVFNESHYDRLTIRQALQKIYCKVLKPILHEKYRMPNYCLVFEKLPERGSSKVQTSNPTLNAPVTL